MDLEPIGNDGSSGLPRVTSPSPLSPVGARLLHFWRVWASRGRDSWTTQTLKLGYKIPFSSHPPLTTHPLVMSSYAQGSDKFLALDTLISQMIAKRATVVVPDPHSNPGFYSRMFLVPKSTGGWRPIIDLSPLNKFIPQTHFKMETPRSIRDSLRKGDFLTSIDLKDAYFHIPIHRSSQPFLRFQWQQVVYQFRALCFGLSTAPHVFTRVFSTVSSLAHSAGIRLYRYLDDWLIAASTFQSTLEATRWVVDLCKELGLLINFEKSDLQPSRLVTYLGMQIDTSRFLVRPTLARIRKFGAILQLFFAETRLKAFLFLRLLGHMASLE